MWPAIIGAAAWLFRTFGTAAVQSGGSVFGAKVVEAAVRHIGQGPTQTVIDAVQPQASREQQISASQELLNALKTNEAFRDEVREILAQHQDDPEAREAKELGEAVERHLESAPAEVQAVTSGAKPITDYTDPLYLWAMMDSTPVSAAQAAFLRSPTFHRVCPVGREDLGFGPESTGGTRYLWDTPFGTSQDVQLPAIMLPGSHNEIFAVCKNGHRWPVFAT